MESLEPKKLALLRILQLLQKHTDEKHLLTQEQISTLLYREYGIEIERKAVGRNISLLKEAGFEIEPTNSGCYLAERLLENSELKLLIDGVLCSKHISPKHTAQLIKKLASLSNKYFKSSIKNIYSVNDWNKAQNAELFLNVEIVDDAIEQNKQITFIYNKYGEDKKLHSSSKNTVSPYQMILHNQHYYLIAYNEKWKQMRHYRMDKITQMHIMESVRTPLRQIEGFENGINYKHISSALPYMFTDKPQTIEFLAKKEIIDQIIDWFGYDIKIVSVDEDTFKINFVASINAMEFWAMQYLNFVEIIKPAELRDRIKNNLLSANKKYFK
ncbi:MAG: WYL domain-containing protein [Clostridiales bacterium]|nr:WYL domain-containing protein [Clostridiales bacterium]